MKPVDIFVRLNRNNLPIKYDTVLAWVNGVRNPMKKLHVVAHFDGNLVELIGLMIGDGHWRRVVKAESYCSGAAQYASKDLGLAERAGSLMALVLGRTEPYRPYWSEQSHVYVVECRSKHLVETLSNALTSLKSLIWRFRVRFLRGLFDAEGCITVRVRRGHLYPRIFLTNSDKVILAITRKMLESLGIKSTIEINTRAGKEKSILGRQTVTNSDVFNICIGRREHVIRFARVIGFRIKSKQEFLQAVVRHFQINGSRLQETDAIIPFLR